MAPLEVSALARAAAAWLPVGVTGCALGHHAVAGQVASRPASAVRSRAPPSANPGGSPATPWARRPRGPGGPVGPAAPCLRIRRYLVPDQSLRAEGAGKTHCLIGGERTE
jgi:hypothetical protein